MRTDTCSFCKYFHVPDDGKIWGLSGICNRIEREPGVLVWDTLSADIAEDLWELPCGAPVIKQFYRCEFFTHNIEWEPGDCLFYDRDMKDKCHL